MKINSSIGSNKVWMSIFLLVAVVFIFSPTIIAVVEHGSKPSSVTCKTFSVDMPLLWLSDESDFSRVCSHGISLLKSPPTVFGSEDAGNALIIFPLEESQPHKNVEAFQQRFKSENRGYAMSYTSESPFDSCLLFDEQIDGRKFVSAFCSNESKGVAIKFYGSHHAFDEARTLIK